MQTQIAPAQRKVIAIVVEKSNPQELHQVFSGLIDYIGEKNYNTLITQITLHDVVLRG